MTADHPGVARGDFLEAMSALPGPVSLITTGHGDRRMGLTASSLCSLSADRPSIIVCVNKSASAHDFLLENGCFGVNILHPSQLDAAELFTSKGVDRFASHQWIELTTGAPILADALVALDCRLNRAIDGFSHTILIGVVEQLISREADEADCLVWHRRRFRTAADL